MAATVVIQAMFLHVYTPPAFPRTAISSQSAVQTGPPPTPEQHSAPPKAPFNPSLPTLFIVGDSTASLDRDLGWGEHIGHYFDTHRINIANRAIAGRSSRTFITEGHWEKVLAEMKPGDFLLLQMSHNDAGKLDGPTARGSLPKLDDSSEDLPQVTGLFQGRTETVRSYGWYMRLMIHDAEAKGVQVSLLTPTVRDNWNNGHIERDFGYGEMIRELAKEEHLPLIDMNSVAVTRFEAMGQERTDRLFPKDHTHTSAQGAELNAQNVVDALKLAKSPLTSFLLPAKSDEAVPPK